MNNVIDLDLNNIQILSVKTGEDSSVVKNNTVTQLADVLDFSAERARRKSVTGISTAETQ